MATRLTTKFCNHICKAGKYFDGDGLFLLVGTDGKAKSWLLRYRFHGRRPEMGLGSYPEVTLAGAREKGREARRLLADDIDPLEHRKQRREKQRLADAKNLNFRAVGENLYTMKTAGDRPWWGKYRREQFRTIFDNRLTSLHNLPIDTAEAAEAITLRLYQDIIGPLWLSKPSMARKLKWAASAICDRACALKVLPANIANPAGKPLEVLLSVRQPAKGRFRAIPYDKIPTLYAKLEQLSQSIDDGYTVAEAARAIGRSKPFIRDHIQNGDLKVRQVPVAIKTPLNPLSHEQRIDPADLFDKFEKVLDIRAGVRPVGIHVVKFAILNGCRPSEAREMEWTEYDPIEQTWKLPWQRTKEGDEIRQDLVIPLAQPAIDIIGFMREQQQRMRMQTQYVFANYYTRFGGVGKTGEPACLPTMRIYLRKALPLEEIKATMHGMRTTFRSWGEEQSKPDGTHRFDEKDLERAIGHAAGFGATEVSRGYSRQARRTHALVAIFDGWAKFVTSGVLEADVIPFIPYRRQQQGG
jgi:integrase